jgi:hypothetical protein
LQIVSTSTFRDSLKLICKRPENGYSSCCHDICDELINKSIDDVFVMNFLIREIGEIRIIKIRIQNSEQNLSKANGFRLIVLCNKKYDEVTLLKVYPKRGKYGQSDLQKSEYKFLLKSYAEEKKAKNLVVHNINNVLEEVNG